MRAWRGRGIDLECSNCLRIAAGQVGIGDLAIRIDALVECRLCRCPQRLHGRQYEQEENDGLHERSVFTGIFVVFQRHLFLEFGFFLLLGQGAVARQAFLVSIGPFFDEFFAE